MATSRISSNNPDWLDVGSIVMAFEEMNKCVITLFGRVENVRGSRELVFLITAEESDPSGVEPVVLASQKCHPTSGNHRTLESAVMWALYQLDWQLAEQELKKTGTTA